MNVAAGRGMVCVGLCTGIFLSGCGGSSPSPPVNPYANSQVEHAPGASAPAPPRAPARIADEAVANNSPAVGVKRPAIGIPEAKTEVARATPATDTNAQPDIPQPGAASLAGEPDVKAAAAPAGPSLPTGENVAQMTLGSTTPASENQASNLDLGGRRETSIDWRVQLDPMPMEYVVPGDSRLGIEVPGLTNSPADELAQPGRIRILYSRTPGPFVGVGLNEGPGDIREVWDLRTKTKVGDIQALSLGRSKLIALSPDGKYFAAKPLFSNLVGVYDVGAEKPIHAIPLAAPFTKLVAFAGSTRLIFDDQDELCVWSLPDLTQLYSVALPNGWVHNAWSISPGGRFFAIVDRSGFSTQVNFVNLADGTTAGRLILSTKGNCLGTAFSPDGSQFAALLDVDFRTDVVQVWDVANGTIVSEHALDEEIQKQIAPHRDYQGRNLEWFPDGSFLLIHGRGVFDADQGELVTALPEATAYEIKVLDAHRILVVNKDQLAPYDMRDLLARAARTQEAGGIAQDASLPPLTKPQRDSIKSLALPGEPIPWSVRAARVQRRSAPNSRPIEIPGGHIFVAGVSEGDSPEAVVMYSRSRLVSQGAVLHGHENNQAWLERFDLRTGTKKRRLELPFLSVMLGVSPSAEQVVTHIANGMNRVDVWSLKDGKHRFGLRPYQERGNSAGRLVEFAEFVNDTLLITVGGERLVLWELPEGQAVYEIPIGRPRPRLTPQRDYILVTDAAQHVLYFLESRTGTAAGSLHLAKFAAETIHSYSVSPDGRFVVTMTRRPSGGELAIYDLETGQPTTSFPLPVTAEVIQWVDEGYLLLDGTKLVSLAQRAVVWSYELSLGMHLRESADDRHWYMAAQTQQDRSFNLIGATLPEAQIAERVTSPQLQGTLLFQPGQQISLAVNTGDVPGHADLSQKVIHSLTQRYAAANIGVAEGQPVRLVINGSSGPTGKKLTNDLFGMGRATFGQGEVIEIAEQHVVWEIFLEHAGQRIWETSLRATNNGSYSYDRTWDAGQIAAAASEQMADAMWNNAALLLLDFEPPKYGFPPGASSGAGKSRLTPRGPLP